jgi:predicted small lipoprotein YifL
MRSYQRGVVAKNGGLETFISRIKAGLKGGLFFPRVDDCTSQSGAQEQTKTQHLSRGIG